MARKAQKLINYHGTNKGNLDKQNLNLGEIAVVHNEQEPLLAIRVSGDTKDELAYFADSASTYSAINTVSNSLDTLAERVSEIETGTTSQALQEIEVTGGTYVKLTVTEKADNKQTITIEDTIVPVESADSGTKGLAEASDVKTYVDTSVSNAKSEIETAYTAADSAIDEKVSSLSGVVEEVKGKADTALQNITAEGDSYVTASAEGNKVTVVTNVATDLSSEELSTGKVADAKAVKDYVDSTKSGMQSTIDDISGKLSTLIGDDANKSVRSISQEEASIAVAKIASGAPEAFDTLVEIAEWIQTSGSSAASVVAEVYTLSEDVDNLQEADTIFSEALSGTNKIASTALQTIEKGSDGEFVTTTVGEKSDNKQSIGVSVAVQNVSEASEGTKGLAEASDVKTYVDTSVSNAKSEIETAYTAADSAIDEKVSSLSGVVEEVKAKADTALQNITAEGDSYVTASAEGNKVTVVTNVATDLSSEELSTGKVADAKAVKDYVDNQLSEGTADFVSEVDITGIEGVQASKSEHKVSIDFTNMIIDCGEF